MLGILENDRITRIEVFPVEDLAIAIARLEELTLPESGPRTPGALENRASRQGDVGSAALQRRDWDTARRLLADDPVLDDRRQNVGSYAVGAEKWVSNFRAQADLGLDVILDQDVIAIRGERLALADVTVADPNGNSIQALTLLELNDEGKTGRLVWFDPEDFDAAFADLDERFMAGEGASHGNLLNVFNRFRNGFNNRDWDKLRAVLAEDLVVSDRRPASLGEMRGPDAWIDAIKVLIDLVPTLRTEVFAYRTMTSDGFVAQMLNQGLSEDGASVETSFIAVVQIRGSVISHWAHFPVEDLDAALAHFVELGRTTSVVPELSNTCTRTRFAWAQAVMRADWNAAPLLIAEDIRREDRRAGFQSLVEGREAFIENLQVMQDVFAGPVRIDTVATRGDRLALFMLRHDVKDGFVVEFPHVTETNDQEQISVVIIHDDLDAAVADLDARYIASEAALYEEVWGSFTRALHAMNVRDWETFRVAFAEEYEFTDHRPASLGRITGREDQVASVRTLVDVIPDVHWLTTAVLRLDGRGGLVRSLVSGTAQGGGSVEMAFLVLFESRDGLRTRQEFFPEDQLAAALNRFDELAPTPTRSLIDNACVRVSRLLWQRYEREDWDGSASSTPTTIASTTGGLAFAPPCPDRRTPSRT